MANLHIVLASTGLKGGGGTVQYKCGAEAIAKVCCNRPLLNHSANFIKVTSVDTHTHTHTHKQFCPGQPG